MRWWDRFRFWIGRLALRAGLIDPLQPACCDREMEWRRALLTDFIATRPVRLIRCAYEHRDHYVSELTDAQREVWRNAELKMQPRAFTRSAGHTVYGALASVETKP